MFKYPVFGVLMFLLASCNIATIEEKEKEPVEKPRSSSFSFIKIEYIEDEHCSESVGKNELYPMTFTNNTGVNQSYTFDLSRNIRDRCEFKEKNPDIRYNLTDDSVKVKVPIAKSKNGGLIYDEGKKWVYLLKEQKQYPVIHGTRTVVLEPGTRTSLTPTYTSLCVMANYKLYLRGNEVSEELIIDGFVRNMIYTDCELVVTKQPL